MSRSIAADFEVTVARAMLAELEMYLESDVVFWQTAPNVLGDKMPKLTIGGLLESLVRAEAAGAAAVRAMRSELETIRSKHLAAYLSHAEQEARSRLDAWTWYLDDYTRSPSDVAGYYPNEVRARFKAEGLLEALEPHRRGDAERRRAAVLDERLRASFLPGLFVWDDRLKSFCLPDRMWWLYGRLRTPEE
jgi:hypothetical protein